jgi:hypothetical protein
MVYTKSTMKKLSGRVVSINILGILGYMSSLLAWLLFIAVFFVLLADSSFMTMPDNRPIVQPLTIPDNLTGVAWAAGYGVAIVAVIVTIIIFLSFPYFVSKGMSRFMKHTLRVLKITYTNGHMWLLKACMAAIPTIGLAIMTLCGVQGDTAITIYLVVFFAALLAFGLFSFQYLLAWRLKIPAKDIW